MLPGSSLRPSGNLGGSLGKNRQGVDKMTARPLSGLWAPVVMPNSRNVCLPSAAVWKLPDWAQRPYQVIRCRWPLQGESDLWRSCKVAPTGIEFYCPDHLKSCLQGCAIEVKIICFWWQSSKSGSNGFSSKKFRRCEYRNSILANAGLLNLILQPFLMIILQ